MRWVQPSSWSRSTFRAWLPKPMLLPHDLRHKILVHAEIMWQIIRESHFYLCLLSDTFKKYKGVIHLFCLMFAFPFKPHHGCCHHVSSWRLQRAVMEKLRVIMVTYCSFFILFFFPPSCFVWFHQCIVFLLDIVVMATS